jgi:hypothetical protein
MRETAGGIRELMAIRIAVRARVCPEEKQEGTPSKDVRLLRSRPNNGSRRRVSFFNLALPGDAAAAIGKLGASARPRSMPTDEFGTTARHWPWTLPGEISE